MVLRDAAMKWRPRMDSHHQPPDSKSGALLVELQGYDPATGVAPVSRRYQRRASLPTLWRNLKCSGISALPRVSRRSERRGLLSSSCPDTWCPSNWWSHGESHPDLRNAIASSCSWTMAPKWSARPDSHRVRAGLQAAASTISASRALKWGGRRVLPPLGDLHRIECWLLHHGLHLKVIRLRVPPPSGLAYKASA
jgi:hypothetical protein